MSVALSPWRRYVRSLSLIGAPGVARTPDLQIRSLPLYPSELQARFWNQLLIANGSVFSSNSRPFASVKV